MQVQQIYTGCLSEAAYFIESDGEAAIIDPLRDYHQYLELAEKHASKIKYIFETHFHADFISGHIDLASKSNAPIIYGPETATSYPVHVAFDRERFVIGKVEIEVLHSPGHTPESTCYLLYDEQKKPYCLFTGDTLFVGDVGRPDLFGGLITKEELASRMFDSLQKLKQLPDEVIIYPAHGPGSSCGKNLGKETWSTMGQQKKTNYALQDFSRSEFIQAITSGLSAPPQYFPVNAKINQSGYTSLDDILEKSLRPLSSNEFEKEMQNMPVIVLDTRNENEFENGFVPGSIFIGLNGRFAEWIGTLLKLTDRILLITEPGKERESVIRMARVGYENVIGYLNGGFDAWKDAGKPVDMIISIDAEELKLDLEFEDVDIVDVRKENEFDNGHVEGAINVVLQDIDQQEGKIESLKNKKLYVHCLGGYRSMIAASLLRRKGFKNIRNIYGGYTAIAKTAIPLQLPVFSES